MDIKEAIKQAGGASVVARACSAKLPKPITRFAVYRWVKNNKLPSTEWSGTTQYAFTIAALAKILGHKIQPIDLCPGAGQYMKTAENKLVQPEPKSEGSHASHRI